MKRQKMRRVSEKDESLHVPIPAARSDQKSLVWAVCLALAVMTFAVFGQTLWHEFINYDDDIYVYENPVVARGLTLKGIVWAFSFHASNWHPLTWLSHMLDCQLYGLHPGGHHLTNLLLHTGTVITLFLVLRQMTGALWRSAFVAALFAIHPLRVESVAWISERKDVLGGLFFMLTVGAYVRYALRPWSAARYGLVMFLFAVGLMCKPMLITMPVVLLLLDYWPLQRKETAARLIKEKLPLLVLSAAVCVATVLAQVGTIGAFESYSMPLRLANALVSCVVYLGQMIWPVGLAAFYPYPHYGLPAREVALSAVLLAGLSLVAVWQCRKRRWLLVGWAWYLVMLLPVLGIIQVGAQAHADRYTYLPQIGVCVAITWLVAELRLSRAALVGLGAGVLGLFMFCAWQQTGYWQDSDTLWSYTLACTTDNDVSQNNLGIVLLRKGKIDAAMACFQRALQIRPSSAEARNNLGLALMQEGKLDAAVTSFHQALETRPDFAEAYDNLGYSLLQMGKTDDAITQCRHALQISPDDAQACVNLGNAFVQKGRVADAIAQYRKALEINPGLTTARKNLDSVLLQNAPR